MAFPAHCVCLQPSDAYVEELLAGASPATAALTLPSRSYLCLAALLLSPGAAVPSFSSCASGSSPVSRPSLCHATCALLGLPCSSVNLQCLTVSTALLPGVGVASSSHLEVAVVSLRQGSGEK